MDSLCLIDVVAVEPCTPFATEASTKCCSDLKAFADTKVYEAGGSYFAVCGLGLQGIGVWALRGTASRINPWFGA